MRKKRPDQWRNNTWLLHHDNAPAHTALLTLRFWPITWLWCHIHPTRPTLHPATFSYFRNWKWSLRGEDFGRWRKFKQSRRPSWTRYEKMTSKNALKTGSAASSIRKLIDYTSYTIMHWWKLTASCMSVTRNFNSFNTVVQCIEAYTFNSLSLPVYSVLTHTAHWTDYGHLAVVIPMCFLNYIECIWQSKTPIYSQITLTATCLDSKGSSS